MPDGYTIPRVEVTQQIATSPFSTCADNIQKATELYKFLLLKHCTDFLNGHYLYDPFTLDIGLNILEELEVLTRDTPYIAVINRADIISTGELHVSLINRVI